MKVFISQPMRDKTDEEILKERERAIDRIYEKYHSVDVEILDSFFKDALTKQSRCGSLESLLKFFPMPILHISLVAGDSTEDAVLNMLPVSNMISRHWRIDPTLSQ